MVVKVMNLSCFKKIFLIPSIAFLPLSTMETLLRRQSSGRMDVDGWINSSANSVSLNLAENDPH